jgi:hypothetical protein
MKIAWLVCLESICTEEWLVNFESGRLSVMYQPQQEDQLICCEHQICTSKSNDG